MIDARNDNPSTRNPNAWAEIGSDGSVRYFDLDKARSVARRFVDVPSSRNVETAMACLAVGMARHILPLDDLDRLLGLAQSVCDETNNSVDKADAEKAIAFLVQLRGIDREVAAI